MRTQVAAFALEIVNDIDDDAFELALATYSSSCPSILFSWESLDCFMGVVVAKIKPC